MATVADVTARLKELQGLAPEAAKGAVTAMGEAMVIATMAELSFHHHAAGEPTNAPPGGPPAFVSGDLARSIRMTPPVGEGDRAVTVVGGTTVYARIQEFGGDIYPGASGYLANRSTGQFFVTPYSANDHVTLPPRPYLKTAAEGLRRTGKTRAAAIKGFAAVLGMDDA
jgi:phage gpG-like protein